jgi:hypothetical protein
VNESLLAKVRGLLAKAESTEYPAEAEAFNNKAAELIARHGIDEALLAAAGTTTDTINQVVITISNPYSIEKSTLLTAVATSMRCQVVAHVAGRSAGRCTVVGFSSDLERVELIYTSLLLQAVTQVTRQTPDGTVFGWGTSTVAYRKSWWAGFANAVWDRLQETEHRAAEQTVGRSSGVSTELVLRDRCRDVERKFAELFPEIRTSSAGSRRFSDGYTGGHRAGQRADLGGTRIGQHRTAVAK